jgi:hypothetical protein
MFCEANNVATNLKLKMTNFYLILIFVHEFNVRETT